MRIPVRRRVARCPAPARDPAPNSGRPRPLARTLRPARVIGIALALATTVATGCGRTPPAPAVVASGEPALLPETYRYSIAALGFPGARRAFQVGHGRQIWNGEVALSWRWWASVGDTADTPVAFERDGVPVAHWTSTDRDHRVDFEAAAVPVAAMGDTTLLLSVRVTAKRVALGRGRFTMEAAVATTAMGPHTVPGDAPAEGAPRLAARGRVVMADDRIALGLPDGARPAPARARAARVALDLSADLAAGETRTWDFWMPLYPATRPEAELAAAAAHARVVAESRRRWRDWLGGAARLETPDPRVNLAWRAALVTLLMDHEKDRGGWVPIGNPFQYRDVWIRDGARVVRALAVAGLGAMARDDARTLTRFQFPSGALLSQRGQLDGTGQALWALDQASALPASPETAREALPVARAAVDWIERTRTRTRALALPWGGLMPFGDPRDNELTRAELVGNDAWSLAGLRAARALALRAQDSALARRAAAAYDDYLATFRVALERTGHPDVPPSWRGPGRDWGNLSVAYPTGVMSPDDARLARLDARKAGERARSGLIAAGAPDSLHTYLGADLAQWALLAGRPAEARRWLWGVLSHSSSTLGQAEVFHRGGGFGGNLPPHGTAAAMLVDLLRNMVVGDTRDTLELALGGDPAWWSGTGLARAPTRFGVLDVTLRRAGDALEARFTPVPVPVRVRVPDGMRVAQVMTPGGRLAGAFVEGPGSQGVLAFRVVAAPPGTPRDPSRVGGGGRP